MNDTGNFGTGLAVASMVWIFLFLIALPILGNGQTRVWREDAVAHGAAEWVLDTKTGTTTWRWKKPEVEVKP
jgi:hypothetical protein